MAKRRSESTTKSRNPAVWLEWLEEIEREDAEQDIENEEVFGEEDPNEVENDTINQRSDDSDTEQEMDQSDEESHSETAEARGLFYLGKNNVIKWNKVKPPASRTRSHNLIFKVPGPKGIAKNAKTGIDSFSLFIDASMLQQITVSTNTYIEHIKQNYARDRDAKLTDEVEMKAYIGVLYIAGVMKSGRLNVLDLWNTNGFGVEAVYLTMSYNRFRFLCRCLRFDNMHDRMLRREHDKLAPIRQLFDTFVQNCQKNFTPSAFLTIDEQLVAFRGRCPFRQYIPSKPSKYGIKIFSVVDVKNMYTYNLEIYPGAQPHGPYQLSNRPTDVVKRMIEPLRNTKRNITMDNWFSSIPLAMDLLNNYKLTVVATLKKNKAEIPKEFLCNRQRPIKSSMFGFHENITMVSYMPKKNKVVVLISTMHHDDEIDEVTQKPEIIMEYNRTKSGVDVVDKMCVAYNVARNSRRWPLTVFFNLLNIAGINSQIIYTMNTDGKSTRRNFLLSLALELVKPQMMKRIHIKNIPREIRERTKIFLNYSEPSTSADQDIEEKKPRIGRGRCHLCPRKQDKKTPVICVKCQRFTCKNHQNFVCDECVKKTEQKQASESD